MKNVGVQSSPKCLFRCANTNVTTGKGLFWEDLNYTHEKIMGHAQERANQRSMHVTAAFADAGGRAAFS